MLENKDFMQAVELTLRRYWQEHEVVTERFIQENFSPSPQTKTAPSGIAAVHAAKGSNNEI